MGEGHQHRALRSGLYQEHLSSEPLGRLYPDDSDAKKELQTIIEQKLGKSIELHMLVAEDHQQTNLTQITVDQAIRENIHMDVVIEETPGSEPEE